MKLCTHKNWGVTRNADGEVTSKRCVSCKAWLSLGPSYAATPEEIRAAELAIDWLLFHGGATDDFHANWSTNEEHGWSCHAMDGDPMPYMSMSGWLARQIVHGPEEDDEDRLSETPDPGASLLASPDAVNAASDVLDASHTILPTPDAKSWVHVGARVAITRPPADCDVDGEWEVIDIHYPSRNVRMRQGNSYCNASFDRIEPLSSPTPDQPAVPVSTSPGDAHPGVGTYLAEDH